MASQQPELQLGGQLFRNRPRDELSEAGVDAVGVFGRAVSRLLDEGACADDLLPRLVRERRRRSVDGDRPDVLDFQILAAQPNGRGQGHLVASLALPFAGKVRGAFVRR